MEKIELSSSDIIAICASIVAISALATSIWQAYMTRKHNHLSLRPHLNLELSQSMGKPIYCGITNDGIGPGFIQSYEIICDGKPHEIVNYNDYKNVFEQIGVKFDEISHFVKSFNKDTSIAPDKDLRLFVFPSTETDDNHHKLIKSNLPRLEILIKYKCIYGNEFVLNEKL